METESSISPGFRAAVRTNAAFCGLSGLVIVGLAGRLPDVVGAGTPGFYLGLGASLVLYAVHLVLTARRPSVRRVERLLIVGGDAAWVAGSVAVVVAGTLSPLGAGIVLGVAAVVASFALWQWKTL